MTKVFWDESYKIGVKVIDEQHEHFVGLLNKLYVSLESRKPQDIPEIIADLTDYAEHHFKTEEEYFEKYNYPDAQMHRAEHDDLRAKVQTFANRHDKPKKLSVDLLFFLERWLLVHFRGADTKFAKFLKQKGVK